MTHIKIFLIWFLTIPVIAVTAIFNYLSNVLFDLIESICTEEEMKKVIQWFLAFGFIIFQEDEDETDTQG